MKQICVFYYGSWSSSIRNRFIATSPMYVVLDLSAWPSVPTADIQSCKNAGITMCAYIPTGGMRGFIWSSQDTTVKTPAGIKALIDQAFSRGFNGVFFDEGGLYTPVSGQTYQDAYLERYLQSPGRNAGNPPILSVIGNSKYNPTTADSWLGLTVEEYINHAKTMSLFVIVGLPDEYVRSSRINSNIFPLVDAVLTSEEYNTRAPGLAPVGQEIPFTGQCFVLSYNGSFDAPATVAAINHGFGAAYCCESMGTLSSNFEGYMAQIPESEGDMLSLALVYYGSHSSAINNRLIAAQPAFLILNTPGGSWPSGNAPVATFQNAGSMVFSYVAVGYIRDQMYDPVNGPPVTFSAVMGHVQTIGGLSGASKPFGIFFDECNPNADTAGQNSWAGHTIKEACALAHSLGLQVIMNPGTSSGLNANMYSHADYVMTDEHYQGRNPTSVESAHLDQTIVVSLEATSATQAAGWTNTALTKGFAYSYACSGPNYNSLPSWLEEYIALISEEEEMPTNIFQGGSAKVAKVPVTVIPAGVACEAEVFIGLTVATKVATSGKIAFTSTGLTQNVSCPITMPVQPGLYHAYVDLTSGGLLLAGFTDLNDIGIVGGSVGPIVWS